MIVWIPPNASQVHSASCHAGPEQLDLEQEEVAQIEKADVAKSAVAEWASPIVFACTRRERKSPVFCRLLPGECCYGTG